MNRYYSALLRPHCHNDVEKLKEMPTVSVGSSNRRHSSTSSPMKIGQSPTYVSGFMSVTVLLGVGHQLNR